MLRVRELSLEFSRYGAGGFKKQGLKIISRFDIDVGKGEVVAVIGSSGAGKSLLAHAVLGILPKNARVTGTIEFHDQPLTRRRLKGLRGKKIVLIPQSVSLLNPLKTVGRQVYRSAFLNAGNSRRAKELRDDAFARYRLTPPVRNFFPFQVSGGMARRVLTAMATVTAAELIIADEPTTGLDPRASGESLAYLRGLADAGKGIMIITHDLVNVLPFADTIAVFYGGTTVEIARPLDFTDVRRLRHPYTKALYASLPQNGFTHVPGFNPFGDMLTPGCVYEPRCSLRQDDCALSRPERRLVNGGIVWCHHA